jgi:hypothetical protein
MDATAKTTEAGRRSTRIRAQLPVRVTSLDPAVPFSEPCHTLVVNVQGCGVRISQRLEPGLAVQLDDLPTGQVATARVANCVPLGSAGKLWLVGLALDEPGNIWGIAPTPADWGVPVKAIAAAAAVAPAARKNEWPFSQFSKRGEFHPGKK